MKLIRVTAVLLLLAFALAGGLAQDSGPLPVALPPTVADAADRLFVYRHGEDALVVVHSPRFSTLWYMRDGQIESVRHEDGGIVFGDWVHVDLEGPTAFVELEAGGLTRKYLKVENATATPLMRSDGKEVDATALRPRRVRGEVWMDEWTGGPLSEARSWFLQGGVVVPAVDGDGEPLRGLCLPMFDPDGRVRWAVVGRDEHTYRREGATLTPVPEPPRPEDLEGKPLTLDSVFTGEGRCVVGTDTEAGRATAWMVRGDEPEAITGADGEPISAGSISIHTTGEAVYLFLADDDSTSVRRLDGGTAVELKPDGDTFAPLYVTAAPGCLLATSGEEGDLRVVRVDESGMRTVKGPDGKPVKPARPARDGRPGELQLETAGAQALLKIAHGDGEAWCLLDGDTAAPISPGRRWNPSGAMAWAWEHGGRLYVRHEEVHDGRQFEWLSRLEDDGLTPVSHDEEALKGAAVDVATCGGELLVAVKPMEGPARLYRITE